MELKEVLELALEEGFSYAVELEAETIELRDEVRQMCSSNSCGKYGKNWACPPACGELAVCRERVAKFQAGIIVQTVGEIEDSLDFETMMEIEAEHKAHFFAVNDRLKQLFPNLLALGAGCCTICSTCSYPEQECRFPERRISSLEAYGIVVSDLCKSNNLSYYYGPNKIAYTSCFLLF